MNVRSIVRLGFSRGDGLVHRLRPFHGIGRLRHVWLRRVFLHDHQCCNNPALEGRC